MQQVNDFSGIWVPVVTPFASDGSVDQSALRALVRGLVGAGSHGLVACATTGEAAALDDAEKAGVLRCVLDECGDAPVLTGVNGIAPYHVARECRRWIEHAGAGRTAGFLVPPPSCVRPSQAGLIQFYAEVAAAAWPTPIAGRSIRPCRAVRWWSQSGQVLPRREICSRGRSLGMAQRGRARPCRFRRRRSAACAFP